MPIKENATLNDILIAFENQTISSDTTTTGAIIDTAGYDMGLTFAMGCNAYTDGTYTMKIEHGDDSGLSDAADVDSAMLVYGTLPDLAAALTEGDEMPKEGVHSTKRYVRVSIVSTSVTTGADVVVVAIAGGELLKTAQE